MKPATITLTDMAHGGDAVGRHEDQVVFVPLGVPGETVRIELEPSEKRFTRGRIVEVLQPADSRIEAPCPYFGLCGGCQWQHIDYSVQLELKRKIVIDLLERLGSVRAPQVEPVLGMETPWAYRNHVQLKCDQRGRIGYYALKSHDVVSVDRCLVTDPLLNDMWDALEIEFEGLTSIALRAGVATGEQMLILEGKAGDEPALEVDLPVSCVYTCGTDELLILAGRTHLHEELLGRRYQISAPSFFQVNTHQAERLVETVQTFLKPEPQHRLLDAYSGVGTFAHALAEQVQEVVGIESSPWAIKDAMTNTKADNVSFVQGRIESAVEQVQGIIDAVVVDPPRSGCSPEVLQVLSHLSPKHIVYVSCDPAILARDVKQLAALGYGLDRVQPIDMFPQTYHIECVAHLNSV